MGLLVVHGGASASARLAMDWPATQRAQFEHDEKYHREISRLTVQDRLKHMALHFAKYAGRLTEADDDATFKCTAIDTFIIAISCANVLNTAICEQNLTVTGDIGREQFVRDLTIAAGRMAMACEKMDHLEDFPFRRSLRDEVLRLISVTLSLFEHEGWNPTAEMSKRLAGVKQKSIFHERT